MSQCTQLTEFSLSVTKYEESAVQTEGELNDDEPGRCCNIEAIYRNQQCTGGMCNHLTLNT